MELGIDVGFKSLPTMYHYKGFILIQYTLILEMKFVVRFYTNYNKSLKGYKITKVEAIRILILLSQIEGYIVGKVGTDSLPDYMSEELYMICKMLTKHIKGE